MMVEIFLREMFFLGREFWSCEFLSSPSLPFCPTANPDYAIVANNMRYSLSGGYEIEVSWQERRHLKRMESGEIG